MSSPPGVQATADLMVYLGLGAFVPHWATPLTLSGLKILPSSSERPCCCQQMT